MRAKRYECPVAQSTSVVVRFDKELHDDINDAVMRYPFEFLLVLCGERGERVYNIKDVIVPEQRVTVASVEATELMAFNDSVIGYLHSHHEIPAFHSATDRENVDNAPLSVVASRAGWCGKAAVRLPCGRWGVTSRLIFITDETDESVPKPPEPPEPAQMPVVREEIDCPFDEPACGLRIRHNRILKEIRKKARYSHLLEDEHDSISYSHIATSRQRYHNVLK